MQLKRLSSQIKTSSLTCVHKAHKEGKVLYTCHCSPAAQQLVTGLLSLWPVFRTLHPVLFRWVILLSSVLFCLNPMASLRRAFFLLYTIDDLTPERLVSDATLSQPNRVFLQRLVWTLCSTFTFIFSANCASRITFLLCSRACPLYGVSDLDRVHHSVFRWKRYVRNNVRRYVRKNVRRYVRRNVRRYVRKTVKRYVRNSVRRYVRKNVRRHVKDMSEIVSEDMSEIVSEDMSERISEHMWERYVRNSVRTYVRKNVKRHVRKICQK